MHASDSNISLISGRSDSDPLLADRGKAAVQMKKSSITDKTTMSHHDAADSDAHQTEKQDNPPAPGAPAPDARRLHEAFPAANSAEFAAIEPPAGDDTVTEPDQVHAVQQPQTPTAQNDISSCSSTSGDARAKCEALAMQQQSNGRSSATGMEPAGAVHVDAAEVAAAAAELLAESPESPKAVPVGVPIGRRVWCDRGIDLKSRQNPFMEAFALVTMAIYLGFIHLLGLLIVGSLFSSVCRMVLLGILVLHMLPARPLLWEGFLTNPVWRAWRRYFRFSVAMDSNFELAGKKYVIAEYPHGVFPLSQLIAVSLTDGWPGHKIYSLAADSVFHVPLWKHVMTWIGAQPATADNFRRLLKMGSVGLVPGGIAEIFMVEEDREVIKLRDRKGFVRIAVEMGADLVPCYHFGNSRLFGWGPKSWEPLARRHRVALGFLKGRWGLPLPLPQRVPLMMVVGGPIKVKQTAPSDPGFAAAVDEAHAKMIDAMQALYDKYKGDYGWGDRPLIIM